MVARSLFLAILLSAFVSTLFAQEIPDSCGTRDWFQLRARADHGEVSLLCKGVADAAFERPSAATRELQAVIRREPHSADSFDAHGALIDMYSREGRYRKALEQVDLGLAEKPDTEDLKAIRPMFAALAVDPDQTVAKRRPGVVHSEIIGGNLFAPVTVNGVSGTYVLDSGGNISMLCESEAKRLGLRLRETTTTLSAFSGSWAVRVAVAPDLWIGGVHLKHVAFAVAPDTNLPFVDWPAGHKGILGIPVLLALQSLRVEKDNRIVIGGNPASKAQTFSLAFNGATPLVQVLLDGKALSFVFDTGAAHTYLYKPFADAFPERMKEGKSEEETLRGVSGSSNQESLTLPSVTFPFAQGVELAPATVLMTTPADASRWAAGNLGFNVLVKALPLTIDFRTMQLSFDRQRSGTAP